MAERTRVWSQDERDSEDDAPVAVSAAHMEGVDDDSDDHEDSDLEHDDDIDDDDHDDLDDDSDEDLDDSEDDDSEDDDSEDDDFDDDDDHGDDDHGADDDQVLAGAEADDRLKGGAGDDDLSGADGDDKLQGGHGADSLDGGAGDDVLFGGQGADELAGGEGADVFKVTGSAKSLEGLDRVLDFTSGEDRLVFDDAVLDEDGFATATAIDYVDAIAQANAAIDGGADVVAVQLGTDVIVFATEPGDDGVESAIVLVGKTLTDITAGDIG